jgi:hypothetical protein
MNVKDGTVLYDNDIWILVNDLVFPFNKSQHKKKNLLMTWPE